MRRRPAMFWWLVIAYIYVFFLLTSCSTSYHCKHCFQNAQVKHDTVRVDTIILTQRVRLDTIVHEVRSNDTLIIHKANLTIKYRKLPGDTVFLSGECAPDSVRVEIKVPIITEVKTGIALGHLILSIIGALIVGALLVKIFT